MDSLRGSFGAIGSIHRAMSARKSMRTEGRFDPNEVRRRHGNGAPGAFGSGPSEMGMGPVRGVQLYDAPMPCVCFLSLSLLKRLCSFVVWLRTQLRRPGQDLASLNSGIAQPSLRFWGRCWKGAVLVD
jgi:hypothetical protein